MAAQSSTSSTSTKKQKRAAPSTSSSSENYEDSAQGEIFVPDADEVLSRESSSWEGSKSSDSEEESISSTLQRTNIINEHINDFSLSEGESSASFHDDSSYESSVGDDLMPDLYDDSDDEDVDNDGGPDSEEDEEPTWTEEELSGPLRENSRPTHPYFRSSGNYTPRAQQHPYRNKKSYRFS